MQTLIRYIKLPFRFPVAAMQAEVSTITAGWKDHYNKIQYEGSWTALPLRSVNGDPANVVASSGPDVTYKDTPLLAQCPVLQQVIDTLKCEKNAIRLLNLQAGAVIKEHTDAELNFESGEARIHVPIFTNDALEFYLDGDRVVMDSGTCWYMNFNRKHRVVNNGTTDRIHLVIDCLVNDWVRDLFSTNGAWEVKDVIAGEERHSRSEKQQMIQHLLQMNTPRSLLMAKQLEQELLII